MIGMESVGSSRATALELPSWIRSRHSFQDNTEVTDARTSSEAQMTNEIQIKAEILAKEDITDEDSIEETIQTAQLKLPDADQLRIRVLDTARVRFTNDEADRDTQELANTTHSTYHYKDVAGKWVQTDYIQHLKERFEDIKELWRLAEVGRDHLKEFLNQMLEGGGPTFHVSSADCLALMDKEGLRARKVHAEKILNGHKKKAAALLKAERAVEKTAKAAGIRKRKEDRIAATAAKRARTSEARVSKRIGKQRGRR